MAEVVVARFDKDRGSFEKAVKLLRGFGELNSEKRPVTIKVGVFNQQTQNHTSVDVVGAIIHSFNKTSKIHVVESDNYCGTGTERLRIWQRLYSERVAPFNLSEDQNIRNVRVADEQTGLSHVLFKPNVFVSTHVMRTYEKGSILKNLLGLIPSRGKARFHKKLEPALLDMFEAIGGIDLAVLDGTYLRHGLGSDPHAGPKGDQYKTATNVVLVGRDAVAVEAVGLAVAGLNPEETPIIQEAVKRKLGTGDLSKIKILGASLSELKEEFAAALKAAKAARPKGPQTWGGCAHHALNELVTEGFFGTQSKRTAEDVAMAFESKGLKTRGKEINIASALARRVKNGTLKTAKGPQGRLYWTEHRTDPGQT